MDLLVWILVAKLAPEYYKRIEWVLNPISHFRDESSWRKEFKRQWKSCLTKSTTLDVNEDRYRPDPLHWVYTCPAMAKSRFLICKHLVQSVHLVHPLFFHVVFRRRTQPLWKHELLVPLDQPAPPVPHVTLSDILNDDDDVNNPTGVQATPAEESRGPRPLNDMEETEFLKQRQSFQDKITHYANLLKEFADGLHYQAEFNDHRMLAAFEKEGGPLLHLIGACLDRERWFEVKHPGHSTGRRLRQCFGSQGLERVKDHKNRMYSSLSYSCI